MFELFVRL